MSLDKQVAPRGGAEGQLMQVVVRREEEQSAAVAAVDGSVVLQHLGQLQAAITAATDLRTLKDLSDQAAVIREMARRMQLALDGQNRFAEMELRAARRLGEVLRQEVRPGRPKNVSRGGTDSVGGQPLPDWISRNRSSRCQRLAQVPEAEFEAFLAECQAAGRLITQAALLGRVRSQAGVRDRRGAAAVALEPVWSAVHATMDVSVAVAVASPLLRAQRVVAGSVEPTVDLAGNVVVRCRQRVPEWLRALHRHWRAGDVAQAIVVFEARSTEAWFRLLAEQEWSCCFLDGGTVSEATVVAYLGRRRRAFEIAFDGLGAVMVGRSPDGGIGRIAK